MNTLNAETFARLVILRRSLKESGQEDMAGALTALLVENDRLNCQVEESPKDSLDSYQTAAKSTAIYPHQGEWMGLVYAVMGLAGEAGEVNNKVQKIMRDKESILTDLDRLDLAKEVGDVLWYVSAVASELGMSLQDLARLNLEKLKDRRHRDAIKGNGDAR